MSVSIDGYTVVSDGSKSPKTRSKELSFGNGFRNIVVDGFNADEESWDITFIPYATATANALETILLNSVKGASTLLSWTPTGEAVAKIYTAHDTQKEFVGEDYIILITTLRREYIT